MQNDLKKWMRLVELSRPAAINDAHRILRNHGYEILGYGQFAQVFAKPSDPWVLKLFSNDDVAFIWFIAYTKQHPSPHWPIFKSKVFQVNNVYSAIRTERLSPHTDDFAMVHEIQYYVNHKFRDTEEKFEPRDTLIPVSLLQCVDDLSEAAKTAGYVLDMGSGNMMWRGNIPVLLDPVQP
jgi:hypothetical protein